MDPVSARRVKAGLGDLETEFDVAGSPRFERFEVVRRLGLGGMGVVFEAMQTSPRRRVAVKVVRADCFSERARRRFEIEVEALARLHHRGIAQIYEAGMAEGEYGPQPYFAMELLEGPTIIDYAEREGLSVRARLELFAEVCDAIEHAHQRGIVHRDLKPSNIIVDESGERPCPKVLDFGVARATDSDVRSTTVHTDVGQIVGTLAYMSPEQAGGDPAEIDTRSDVYALGVVLYELLTGRVPVEVSRANVAGAVRAIQEEPLRPLGAVDRRLRGDLETIVGKALSKEKDRRYAGAAALGADVRRYLNDEPIEARPPSAVYQARKFARRHRGLVGIGIVAVLGLVGASVVGVVFGVGEARARRSADEARHVAEAAEAKSKEELARAEALVMFMKKMLAGVDPDNRKGMDTTLFRAIMDAAAKEIDKAGLGPGAEAEIRMLLGLTYRRLAEFAAAKGQLELGVKLLKSNTPRSEKYLEAIRELGLVEFLLGDFDAGRRDLGEAIALGDSLGIGSEEPVLYAKSYLATLEDHAGNRRESLKLNKEIFETMRQKLGPNDRGTLSVESSLGLSYQAVGMLDEAEEAITDAYERRKEVLGEDAEATITSHYNVGFLLEVRGRHEEAQKVLEGVLEDNVRVLGPDSPRTLMAKELLADVCRELGQLERCESLQREVLAGREKIFGPSHPETLIIKSKLGWTMYHADHFEEARQELEGAREGLLEKLGAGHVQTTAAFVHLGWTYAKLNLLDESKRAFDDALQRIRAMDPPPMGHYGSATLGLGETLLLMGNDAEAIKAFEEAYPILVEQKSPKVEHAVETLVTLYERQGNHVQAEAWRAKEGTKAEDAGSATGD